jgi:DNA-binding NarL/FixJ family response regulator
MLLWAIPDIRVLTLSVSDDRTAIAALRAGAVGHIAKDTDPEDLAELVVRAANGEVIVSQGVMPALVDVVAAERLRREEALTRLRTSRSGDG